MANLKLNNVVVVTESAGAATVLSGIFKAKDGTAAFTVADSTGAATFSGDIKGGTIKAADGTAAITIANSTGAVALAGDLTVSGTTTTVDTALTVSDATVINNAGSDVGLKINSTSSGHIVQLQDNGTDVLVVKDGGNVGIGTSAPEHPLHLATATVNVGQIIQGSYNNNANPNLTFRKSNGSIASPTAITSGHYAGQIRFNSYDGNSWHGSADIICVTSGTVADGRVAGELRFRTAPDSAADVSERMRIDSAGHTTPGADNTQDLGSASKRWRNIYTGDLHLSNDRGNWTVIEEEDYLTLRNNKTDKVYKLVMEEIE